MTNVVWFSHNKHDLASEQVIDPASGRRSRLYCAASWPRKLSLVRRCRRLKEVAAGGETIRVTRAPAGGIGLKPGKAIHLPDTPLGLSPLTPNDEDHLAKVIQCADIAW